MQYTLITRDGELKELVERLRQEKEIAVDLEMEANYHHYGLHLSLVQLSTRKNNWIIDALAIANHQALCDLFADPHICKVFHDVSFDFRVLHELWSCLPQNVIDTKMAALICGRESISLGGLLEEEFALIKNKQCQRADWMKRPLSQKMLDYAALDTSYLLKLKDALLADVKEKGRMAWFEEEMKYISEADYSVPKTTCQDVKGSRSLTEIERGRLQILYAFRDRIAKKYDKPHFFIMPDKRMIDIVKNPPSAHQWKKLYGVHPAIRQRGQQIFSLLQQAKPLQKSKRAPKRRLNDAQMKKADELIDKARKRADALGIQTPLLLTRDQAIEIACTGSFETLKNWQREQLFA